MMVFAIVGTVNSRTKGRLTNYDFHRSEKVLFAVRSDDVVVLHFSYDYPVVWRACSDGVRTYACVAYIR